MDERLTRWRLVLGRGSEQLGNLDPQQQARSDALGYLYDLSLIHISEPTRP